MTTTTKGKPMTQTTHRDPSVDAAFRNLQNALISWERSTGRQSVLIFRELDGLPEQWPRPSLVAIRWDNGIPVDPGCADMSDAAFLARFSDS
jgi:hypothetical protein